MRKATAILFTASFLLAGVAMAVEEPKYTVESKSGAYEIRAYPATLVAETRVDSSFSDAGNAAFRILAGYIFGDNKSKAKIDMTAPVSQKAASEKIAMTAPVSQVAASGGYLVQFAMPASYTLETLPQPNDTRVTLREVPARRVAVIRYRGGWSEKLYLENLNKLQAGMKKDGLSVTAEPVWFRYDPPFQLWFLRRNEIAYELPNK